MVAHHLSDGDHRPGRRHARTKDRARDQRRLAGDAHRAGRPRRVLMPLHPNESPGFLLWHATLRWQRGIAQALAPLDLTHVQFVLLACTWWLNDQGVQPNQVAVASQAGTDIKMTSQVLRSLERKGLIEREIDSADTRARRIQVTERGAGPAPPATARGEEGDARLFADIPQ